MTDRKTAGLHPAIPRGYISPACRLASQEEQYLEEHSRCPGNLDVHLPGGAPGEPPIEKLHCSCACHAQP